MSTRWARTALCTLAVATAALAGSLAAGVPAQARQLHQSAVSTQGNGPPLTLVSQTPWVTPAQPWFNITLGVSPSAGSAATLHVNLTFYGRIDNASQLQQAVSGTPSTSVLAPRDITLPVVAATSGLAASECVTVLPDDSASPPAGGPGVVCPAGTPTVVLGCTPLNGICPDVYPVTVSLLRQGSSDPLARFTTFMTYDEPDGPQGATGSLRVGMVVPVTPGGLGAMAGALTDHREVATTLAVSPVVASDAEQVHNRADQRALDQLDALTGDEVLGSPYVPINLASLSGAGLTGEITAQISRGDDLLHTAGLKPGGGTWIDATSSFSQANAAALDSGLHTAGASQLVLSDNDLASAGTSNYTFAQPFTLDLGHGSSIQAAAADSSLGARFTQDPGNPVLGANQLLAALSFVHFENAYLRDPRGVVVVPPASWQPSQSFMETLLAGLGPDNPSLEAVTLSQLFAQVPVGGNREPSDRRLQSGSARSGITHTAADRIASAREQLASFSKAIDGHPAEMTALGDALLTTEARGLSAVRRAAALNAYERAFAGETDKITLATQGTVTFTAQRAAIPVTVLSAAPYPVTVVVTLASDKFTFPDGNTRQLVLDRPTTSVRVTAQARTSGDRLPIDVTLQTPNGQLTLGHTVLTVHSTSISFVGVALTVLAGAVLLVWWVRTWRRSRRRRPRAQH